MSTKELCLEKFFGLDENANEESVKPGYASHMVNFRITDDHKLKKRGGIDSFISLSGGEHPLCVIYTKVDNDTESKYYVLSENFLWVFNKQGVQTGKEEFMAPSASKYKTMFVRGKTLHIMDGNLFYTYQPSKPSSKLTFCKPYAPVLLAAASPDGQGTKLEEVNIINDNRRAQYISDGISITYILPEKPVDSVLSVQVNGVTKTCSYSTLRGEVTITPAPALGAAVEIVYSIAKVDNEKYLDICSCTSAMFYSGKTDVDVFVYGNSSHSARRYWSAKGDPTYYPVSNHSDVGDATKKITSIVRHYDRQLIFTEDEVYYSYLNINDGLDVAYPLLPLSTTGNVPYDGVLVVNDVPLFVSDGIYAIKNTAERNEKFTRRISGRVEKSFGAFAAEQIVTADYKAENEAWFAYRDTVIIYNYKNDLFYKYQFPFEIAKLFYQNNKILISDSQGKIYAYDKTRTNDNINNTKTAIAAEWEMPYSEFFYPHNNKFSNRLYVSFDGFSDSVQAKVHCQTDGSDKKYTGEFIRKSFSFGSLVFSEFAFCSPHQKNTLTCRLNAKKYRKIKIGITSDGLDCSADVASITLPANFGTTLL